MTRDDLRRPREGRITPGCGGLYRDDQVAGWRRIVDFVHTHGTARDRRADRPQRPQGLDEADVGGRWTSRSRAAAGRSLGPVAAAVLRRTARVPREMTRADMDRVRDEFVARDAARRRGRLRPARGPHGARLPAVLVPLAADQPAHRRVRRRPRRAARASRSRSSTPAAPPGPRRSRCPCASRRPTGIPAASTATTPSRSRAMLREHDVDVVDVSTGQVLADQRAGLRAQLPDPVRRPDPQRGRRSRRSPSARSRATTTSTRRSSPAAPTSARSAARTSTTRYWTLHAAAEQGYGRHGVDRPVPGGQPAADGRPPRRAQAAAAVVRPRRP